MAQTHPIDRLAKIIAARKKGDPKKSYTAKLLREGVEKCAKKLGEESVEAVIAAVTRNKRALVLESADVLYHLLVVWTAAGVKPERVYAELKRRERISGLTERASRKN